MSERKRSTLQHFLTVVMGGIYGPSRKTLSAIDVHLVDGVVWLGDDFRLTPDEARSVAYEILRRVGT